MDALPYAPGDLIAAKYRLTELLGEGGMGAVWRAKNVTLDADVAIKLLRRERANNQLWENLRNEARTTAMLGHRAIVRVFDFGESERGDPFVVMEHLEGPLLADVLDERGRVPADEAVRMLLPIASALAAAHEKGVVHRDVKPENVLLASDGPNRITPKLIDFGVAKLGIEQTAEIPVDQALIGTPAYMSPEQAARRSDIDARTDIWALCVVLYELVAGTRPWLDDEGDALLSAIQSAPPLPLPACGIVEDELWEIIARGLEKDPDARWASMGELGKALAEWARKRDIVSDLGGVSIAVEWLGLTESQPPPPRVDRESAAPRQRAKRLLLLLPDDEAPPSAELASHQSVPPPAAFAIPTPPKRGVAAAIVLGIVVAMAIVVQDARRSEGDRTRFAGTPAPAPAAPVIAAPAAARGGAVEGASTADPRANPSDSQATVPASAEREPVAECMARMIPDSGLERAADIGLACEEVDPKRGADRIKTELVHAAAGRVTEGMRQWALLGWYEMAAFAAVRTACCAGEVEFAFPSRDASCRSLAQALRDVAGTVRQRRDPEEAIRSYGLAIRCAVTSGIAAGLPYGDAPRDGEESAFRRILSRAMGEPAPPAPAPSVPQRARAAATATFTADADPDR